MSITTRRGLLRCASSTFISTGYDKEPTLRERRYSSTSRRREKLVRFMVSDGSHTKRSLMRRSDISSTVISHGAASNNAFFRVRNSSRCGGIGETRRTGTYVGGVDEEADSFVVATRNSNYPTVQTEDVHCFTDEARLYSARTALNSSSHVRLKKNCHLIFIKSDDDKAGISSRKAHDSVNHSTVTGHCTKDICVPWA